MKGEAMPLSDPQVLEAVAGAEFQLLVTPEGRADPYPHYDVLRTHAPVHHSAIANGWLLTRYEDCHAVLRDPRFGRGYVQSMNVRSPHWRSRPSLARGERSMLNLDGPEHLRLRRLVVRSFTPRTVQTLRPRIEGFVDELVDALEHKGGGDLMSELAFPLPVRVIGELLGVPEEDQASFRHRVQALTAIFEVTATPDMLDGADVAQLESDQYFTRLVESKRSQPGDDLLSQLVAEDDSGDQLTTEELVNLALLLFAAGFETTTNLIGNAMVGLLLHPEQMDLLRRHPEYFENLPDELLRYDGTVQIAGRLAAEPVEVGGTVIPGGEPVFPLVGAANHDPARYPNPEALDVTRTDIRPLTFGGGVHLCLGAALARVETEIVFRKLLERLPTIEAAGEVSFRDRLTLRGPVEVPLSFDGSGGHQLKVVPAESGRTVVVAGPPASKADEPPTFSVPGDSLPLRPGSGVESRDWLAEFRARVEASAQTDAEVEAVAGLLGRVPLFSGCTASELADLAATTYPISFDPGEVLCAEGADSPECYVVAEGEASVEVDGTEIAVVRADDVVGERGPLLGAPRNATVRAKSHMLTYAISRQRLLRLAQQSEAVRTGMEQVLQHRYGDRGALDPNTPA